MASWKGISARCFTPLQFEAYVKGIHLTGWKPQFVVLHNTGVPKLADWHKVSGIRRMFNLQNYYQNQQKWSAGPHLFVADFLIWEFTPLTTSGIHSPSWNSVSWGVEMVGDYESEPFSRAVRQNAIIALSALHSLAGLDPRSLKLHKEDKKTTHACPGSRVSKSDMIAGILQRMTEAG
ncbi:peptidoglycan recognition family protein [Bryobacter aggregatus]|uniref:peptidoglycan recognition protein family protein n=1 Tax=Bryobacter aggregatus TaxID=360054 RepID=UPI0004E0EBBD|nr:peptidoglycan recognition family protein [Bryobacter aggregatus]